jgi:hypothetical protein
MGGVLCHREQRIAGQEDLDDLPPPPLLRPGGPAGSGNTGGKSGGDPVMALLQQIRSDAKIAQRKTDERMSRLSDEVAAVSRQLQSVVARFQQ